MSKEETYFQRMQKETFGEMEKKLEKTEDGKERVEIVTQSLSKFYAKMFNDLDARLRKLGER
jgi:uncharacterized tellurite resistance protein B-like protein